MSDMTHPAFPHVLSPEVIASFARDGFVKTEDVLTDDELRVYSTAVDLEIAARTAADTRSVADKTTYEQSFIPVSYTHLTLPTIYSV